MGLEIDLPRLRKTARSAILISQLSIVLPFGLGLLLAQHLYSSYAPEGFAQLEFSLFIGVALSITAFPVLARILADSSLHKTRLADLALTCAAIDDITAWCLVAVITGLTGKTGNAWATIVLTVAYVLLMLVIVRPFFAKLIPRLEEKFERLPEAPLALAIKVALTSSAITEVICRTHRTKHRTFAWNTDPDIVYDVGVNGACYHFHGGATFAIDRRVFRETGTDLIGSAPTILSYFFRSSFLLK